jgi:hypothetical protein
MRNACAGSQENPARPMDDAIMKIHFASATIAAASNPSNQTPRSAGAETESYDYLLVAATVMSDLEGSNATRVSSLFSIPSTRASTRATCTASDVIPSFALRKSEEISLAYQPIIPRQIAITAHSVCQSLSLFSRDMMYGYAITTIKSTR